MGKLLGGGSKSTTQKGTSETKPWEKAIPHLENILSDVSKLYDAQGGINADFVEKQIAPLEPEMRDAVKNMIESPGFKQLSSNIMQASQAGLGGIGKGSGVLGEAAEGRLGISSQDINQLAKDLYKGEVVQSQVDQLGKNVREQLGEQIQGLNQQAVASGSMGSSRAGVEEGVAKGRAAEAIATGSAQIQNQAIQDAMNRAQSIAQGNVGTRMQGAQGAGQLGLGAGNLQSGLGAIQNQMTQNQLQGAGILQNQAQNVADTNWVNQVGQQQAGWDALSKYLGVAGPIGGMGGSGTQTGTTTAPGQSKFNQLMGLASTGAGIMGSLGYSDASLKKKVKRTGKKDGIATYDWEWNKSAEKKLGLKGKAKGVLAQDVAKSNPEAVERDPASDKLMVDYGVLSEKIETKGKK